MMTRVAQNASGVIVKKDICSFNAFGDVRDCTDFDTSVSTKEMKDKNGTWVMIEQN